MDRPAALDLHPSALRIPAPAPACCVHCGLPIGRRWVTAEVEGEKGAFCCFGCVLAQQVTRARGEAGAAASILVRLGLAVFFAMNTMMLTLPTYGAYVYGDAAATDGPLFHVLRCLALCTTVPVIVLLGWPILSRSVAGLRAGAANTDALIVLGTAAAFGISVVNTFGGNGAVYYDTAAMLLVLVTLGRYLEARARADAGAVVRRVLAPAPAAARRLREWSAQPALQAGAEETVAPEDLEPGDVVRVAAGDAFPTDGVVVGGIGGVDEAALTGESRPVLKEVGSPVSSGTCSLDGVFTVRVTARAADSAASRIAALLEAARRERTPAELLADRVSAVLVPAVVAIALAAGFAWTMRAGLGEGVLVALAVLVVACPCGLGIATPVAVWTGLASAARRGIVLRTGAAMERLVAIRQIQFDKTGTVTDAVPRLVGIEAFGEVSEDEILRRAAALEHGLNHPLARAMAAAVGPAVPAEMDVARDVRVIPGRGVRGVIAGEVHVLGSTRFAAEANADRGSGAGDRQESSLEMFPALAGPRPPVPDPRSFAGPRSPVPDPNSSTDPWPPIPSPQSSASLRPPAAGPRTTVLLWTPRALLGALHFAEAPRDGVAASLAALRERGIEVGMMTGDASAASVVPGLFAAAEVATGLSPEEKLDRLKTLRRGGALAMVGDGINDAPALAAADVGIAVADATDLARLTADVVLLGGDLERLPWLLAHATKVRRVMIENLAWAFGYNAIAVVGAAAGLLTPVIASLAMIASSAAVVANARRLRE